MIFQNKFEPLFLHTVWSWNVLWWRRQRKRCGILRCCCRLKSLGHSYAKWEDLILENYISEARATQSHLHIFAQVEDEQVLKKKRKLGFLEFFDITHKRKDGTYVKDESKLLMKAAREKIEELQANEPSKDHQALKSKAWTYYMGDDRPGRARGFGTRVAKTQVNGFRADLMKMQIQESNQNCPRAELQNLHNKLAEHKQMFDQHVSMTNQTIGQLQSELYLYRITFGAQMHPTTFGMFCGNPMDPRSASGGGENALTGDSLT